MRWGTPAFLKINRGDIAEFCLSHFRTIALCIVAMLTVAIAPDVVALRPPVSAVHWAAQSAGTVGIIAWIVSSLVIHANDPESLKETAKGVIVGTIDLTAGLTIGLATIRYYADLVGALLDGTMANPLDSLAIVSGLLLAYVVFVTTRPHRHLIGRDNRTYGGYAVAQPRSFRAPRTPRDIERTAVHEAGHLLLFAVLPEIPPSLKVEVLADIGPEDPYRGTVFFERARQEGWTRELFEWEMLMRRAGAAAEDVILGGRTDGALSDHQAWISVATRYLSEGFGEPFYAEGTTQSAVAHNRAVLESLQVQQQRILLPFLEVNAGVLRELTDALRAKKSLVASEIRPFLEQVVFTASVRPLRPSRD